ncbi:MAG: hypothetical protein AAFR83_12305 [Cyanobacteria bacterium J06629_18]
MAWYVKLIICLIYDFLDFTIGRTLFPIPFIGEFVGCALCLWMFGKDGWYYALEGIDVTEQIDAFIPSATIIALKNIPKHPLKS